MSNPIGWVEIPVTDMARAITFYNDVFGWSLVSEPFGKGEIAVFPSDPNVSGSSGALACQSDYEPSETAGPLIYFTCDDACLWADKSEKAGGRIVISNQPIPPYGVMSVVIDVEGNRIAFHSPQ